MPRVVVVGAGLAGHRAAVALRKHGYAHSLLIVGDEQHLPYDRPPLSKQALSGETAVERLFFPVDDLNVSWVLGDAAVTLDPSAQALTLSSGREIEYDGLIIATGRSARPWPELLDFDGVHLLRGLDDCRRLGAAMAKARDVVIVGAGFVGCEVAATLRLKHPDVSVTLVDIAELPMAPLGAEVGQRAADLHERHGVNLRLGSSIAGIDGSRTVEQVVLDSGEVLPADTVLLALGSVPNTDWLESSGAQFVNGAVLCDAHCRVVGFDGVMGAGDAVAFPHSGAQRTVCIEHWSNARDMAAVAARNLLAGGEGLEVHAPTPTFWSDQYDTKLKSAGFVAGAEEYIVVDEDIERGSLVVEARAGGELVGAIVFNANKRIIQYQRQLATA